MFNSLALTPLPTHDLLQSRVARFGDVHFFFFVNLYLDIISRHIFLIHAVQKKTIRKIKTRISKNVVNIIKKKLTSKTQSDQLKW